MVHYPVRQLIFNPPEIVQPRTAAGSLREPDRGCGCSRLDGGDDEDEADETCCYDEDESVENMEMISASRA
jgi:hypothetical protein